MDIKVNKAKFRQFFIGNAIVSLVLLSAMCSYGDTDVQTESLPLGLIPPTNNPQQFTFNKFDASQGTLNSVTISYVLSATGGSLGGDNETGSQQMVNFTHGLTSTAILGVGGVPSVLGGGGAGFSQFPALDAAESQSIILEPDDGDQITTPDVFNSGGPDEQTIMLPTAVDSADLVINSTFHGQYTGAGTFMLETNLTQTNEITGGGVSISFSPRAAVGNITVTYDFTPPAGPPPDPPPPVTVPTLSEWGIISLTLGLAGLAFIRMRRLKLGGSSS